ncbi:glycosyl-phosphatidylinositol-anchored molecule-like protein [Eulemur rufifrons]|uniref:glycosyl-phosphatidylinositol-anchored molecule-like protein n=1 Tax=Eulemur rufifrons TaxID=859984 RepID=UPI0037443AFD
MLPFALLLAMGLPLVGTNITTAVEHAAWTYNLECKECAVLNNFNCPRKKKCPYEIRRCMTLSIRVSSRELLVYKNCTKDCKFVYEVEVPPEAPRTGFRSNHFYFVRCCNGMVCNEGGPTNIEKDIIPDETIEEELPEGTVRFGESKCALILASVIVSNTLT